MSYINDSQAGCLANTYGLCPPCMINHSHNRTPENGKYEPDHYPFADERTMVLASFVGKTNVLVQYNPDDLEFE